MLFKGNQGWEPGVRSVLAVALYTLDVPMQWPSPFQMQRFRIFCKPEIIPNMN